MAISNDVLSSTLRILLDEEVDNLFKSTPLLTEMRRGDGLETYDGGQKLDVPVILEEHSQITQLTNGYEPVNLAVKDALRTASYNWCDFVAPVVIHRCAPSQIKFHLTPYYFQRRKDASLQVTSRGKNFMILTFPRYGKYMFIKGFRFYFTGNCHWAYQMVEILRFFNF